MENSYEKYCADLDEYIATTKSRLSDILSALEWNEVEHLKESPCGGHLMVNEDKEDPCDPLLPESFASMHSIVIDEEKLKKIVDSPTAVIPKRFSDIQLNFTREQKLALYDYVVQNTGKISEPELKVSMSRDNQGASDMTFAEIVAKAKKRDKRLKRKYRISKPTHIEEVRNLVHLQMQALAQYFNPNSAWDEKESDPGYSGDFRSRKAHKVCYDSRSRRRSRSLSRDKKRFKHERDWSQNWHRRNRERSEQRKNRSKDREPHSKDRKSRSKSRSRSKGKKSHRKERKRHSKDRRSRSTDRENRSKDRRYSKKAKKHSKSSHKSSKSKKSKRHHKSKDKH